MHKINIMSYNTIGSYDNDNKSFGTATMSFQYFGTREIVESLYHRFMQQIN